MEGNAMSDLTFKKIVEIAETLKEAPESVGPYQIPIEFYRRPRTKNRRIIKKWKKRAENWRVPKWFKIDRRQLSEPLYNRPKIIIDEITLERPSDSGPSF